MTSEGTAAVGLPLGDCDGWFVGEDVGLFGLELFVGFAVPSLTQIPLWQVPNGMELQGVESDTNCGEGQLPSELQDTVSSHSLSLPHKHSASCTTCL